MTLQPLSMYEGDCDGFNTLSSSFDKVDGSMFKMGFLQQARQNTMYISVVLNNVLNG